MFRTATALAVPAAVLLAALASAPASADVLLIERTEQAQRSSLPANGLTMSQVESRYGVPEQKLPPVAGYKADHPAITRWHYPAYTVYFENQRVISAVLDSPTPVAGATGTPVP